MELGGLARQHSGRMGGPPLRPSAGAAVGAGGEASIGLDPREKKPGGRCPSCGKDRDQPSGPFLFSSVAFSYPRESPLRAPWGWGCCPDLWALNRGGQGGHRLWLSDSDCSLAHRIPRLTPHRTPLLGSSDSSSNTPSDSLCSTPSLAPVSLHGHGHRCRTVPVRGVCLYVRECL